MRVTLSDETIQGQPRWGINYGFSREINEALKRNVISVRFWKGSKTARPLWHIPRSRIAVGDVATALRGVGAQLAVPRSISDRALGPMRHDECGRMDFPFSNMQPWDHQSHGTSAMAALPGFLAAWDMGSGKTKAVYDLIVNSDIRRALVVCPFTVCEVWENEREKHGGVGGPEIRVQRLDKRRPDRKVSLLQKAIEAGAVHESPVIVVINYESVWTGKIAEAILDVEWDLIVADESHRIKSPKSKSTKWMATKLAHRGKRRVGLSGTPLGNGQQDIFGQAWFLDPGLFGDSWPKFRDRYFETNPMFNSKVERCKDPEGFNQRLEMICTSVSLKDVVDLPPTRDIKIEVELEAEGMKVYRSVAEEMVAEFEDGTMIASNTLTRLLRLQQITGGWLGGIELDDGTTGARRVGKEKERALRDLIDGISPDEPVVVFTRFTTDTRMAHTVAVESGRDAYEISGSANTLALWRDACDSAGAEGRAAPVIVVQIQSGGAGIDLTRAAYCVYMSVGFSLTDYMQSRARTHRPGQSRSVTYYHLAVKDTVDQYAYRVLSNKRQTVESTMESLNTTMADAISQAGEIRPADLFTEIQKSQK